MTTSSAMVDKGDTHTRFLRAYEDNADALFRFAYFRTRERAAALDAVQETYLRTWKYLSDGETIEELRPFLFRTLRNFLIDTGKKSAIRTAFSLDAFMEEGGDVADPKDAVKYDPMDIEEAMRLLNELEPLTYRDAVHLRFIEGYSPKEIAAILSVSENIVSVRIARGIAKLKKLFTHNNEQ